MPDFIVKARERIEAHVSAMDPLTAIDLLEAASELLAQHLAADTLEAVRRVPSFITHPGGTIAAMALAPSMGSGMSQSEHGFHVRQLRLLLSTIVDDCHQRADMVRQWIDHSQRRVSAGNPIRLVDIPGYVVDHLVDTVTPDEGDVDPQMLAAMLQSLKSGRLEQQALTMLKRVEARLDKHKSCALFQALDPWTRDWLAHLLFTPAGPLMPAVGS